jgi:CDP-diacylglycerol--glycerol-3-phosphate 3-phosphatidyltransferase
MKPRFWNLPNSITVGRIGAVPIVALLLLFESYGASVAALILFVAAMLSDILDGYLARKLNLMSRLGGFLDPLADKLMVTTALIMLIPSGRIPAWLVLILLCRELAINSLRTIAMSEGLVLAASPLGKFKTAFQATALGFLIYHVPMPIIGADCHTVGLLLLYMALVFSLGSAADYFMDFVRASNAAPAA